MVAMLKQFVATRLRRYVKGIGSEQVSARLLAGELSLSDVELDLSALSEVLTDALPYTLDLSRVYCKSVSVKVPWQAPRRHPLCVEVKECEVEIQVHRAHEHAWLTARTVAQREWLLRGAIRAAEETLRDEEDEQRQLRDVEAKLRVGLKEVIGDGLRVAVSGLRVTLTSAAASPEAVQPTPFSTSLALSISSISTVPCTHAGARVDRPEDVYEVSVQDPVVRLHRLVELQGLKLSSSYAQREGADGNLLLQNTVTVAQHIDSTGPIRIWVEQQRLSGFIPHHRTRRVCPFSCETHVGIHIENIDVQLPESRLPPIAALIVDMTVPPFVPPEALPSDLLHLHWRTPASDPSATPAKLTLEDGNWPTPASTLGSMEEAFDDRPEAALSSTVSLDASGTSSCYTWMEPKAATGACSGLEVHEQLVDRRRARRVTVQVQLRELAGSITTERNSTILVSITQLAFTRDAFFSLEAFERRCLVELALLPDATIAASSTAEPASPSSGSAARAADGQLIDSPPSGHTSRKRRSALQESPKGSPKLSPKESPKESPCKDLEKDATAQVAGEVSGSHVCSGAAGRLEEPGQPEFGLNTLTLDSAAVHWQDREAGGRSGGTPLLQLERKTAPAITFRWKDLPPTLGNRALERSWQPVEGCVRNVRVTVDVEALRTAAEIGKRCMEHLQESLIIIPFESGWCRIAIHGVELVAPSQVGQAFGAGDFSGVTLSVPSVLLTSVPGLGELFRSLEALPTAPSWSLPTSCGTQPAAPPPGTTSSSSTAQGASSSTCSTDCACGRELADGKVRVAGDFVPLRGRLSARAWAAKQGLRDCDGGGPGGFVAMSHVEFGELVRAQIASEAGAKFLPQLEELRRGAADTGDELKELGELRKKKKGKRSSKRSSQNSTEEEVQKLARRWAELQETVRRLQTERTEIELRRVAFKEAADSEMARFEKRSVERETDLAVSIAQERAVQADLSARAEEQRRAIDDLLRNVPTLATSLSR